MKQFSFCILLVWLSGTAVACNVCGSAAGNQSLGILAEEQKHFAGLQYQYNATLNMHPGRDANHPPKQSRILFHSVQAWGGFSMSNKIRLYAFIPYRAIASPDGRDAGGIYGQGDISLLANVRLINKDGCDVTWQQFLQIGGGLKLPTGKYDRPSGQSLPELQNVRIGTNSWDFIMNGNYLIRNKRLGISIDASYVQTTPNTQAYKYGNRLNSSVLAYFSFTRRAITLTPVLGLKYEHLGKDYDDYSRNWTNDMTGGSELFAAMGIQTAWKQYALLTMAYLPIHSDVANGLAMTQFKLESGLRYFF